MTTDTEKYREHLDWHFKQNKREKEEMKVAKFRRWYYSILVSVSNLIFNTTFIVYPTNQVIACQ